MEINLNPDRNLFNDFRWNCSVFEVINATGILVIELKIVQVNVCEKFHSSKSTFVFICAVICTYKEYNYRMESI